MPETTSNTQTTTIAAGTSINGEMHFTGPTNVLGELHGSISSTDRIEIGREARVAAEVNAENVLVDGSIEGNITARDKLQLNASAHVDGDVIARTLIVSEGASFTGHCRVGAEAGTRTTGSTNNRGGTTSTTTTGVATSLNETKGITSDDEVGVAPQLSHAS